MAESDGAFFQSLNIVTRWFCCENSVEIGKCFSVGKKIGRDVFSFFVIKHSCQTFFHKENGAVKGILFAQQFPFCEHFGFGFFAEKVFGFGVGFDVFRKLFEKFHGVDFLQK